MERREKRTKLKENRRESDKEGKEERSRGGKRDYRGMVGRGLEERRERDGEEESFGNTYP